MGSASSDEEIVVDHQPNFRPKEDKIRCVAISDTHCKTDKYKLPEGDILFHAGDFS